jgi:hypothetical protein
VRYDEDPGNGGADCAGGNGTCRFGAAGEQRLITYRTNE